MPVLLLAIIHIMYFPIPNHNLPSKLVVLPTVCLPVISMPVCLGLCAYLHVYITSTHRNMLRGALRIALYPYIIVIRIQHCKGIMKPKREYLLSWYLYHSVFVAVDISTAAHICQETTLQLHSCRVVSWKL